MRTHRMLHPRSQTEEVAAADIVAVAAVDIAAGVAAVAVDIAVVAVRSYPETAEKGCSHFAAEQRSSVGKIVAD